ncbi:MAG TPA: DUF1572 family protein [Terracidiphilus sp.]|nr:DUF1572 family protein [Terracidiphilus sp.]
MSAPDPVCLFLDFSHQKLFGQYAPRLRTCVDSLTEEQVWWRANPASNSVGNLVLHLNGNVGQWLVASFNRLPDERDRPAEFHEQEQPTKAILMERFNATLARAEQTLLGLTAEDLLATWIIQGYTITGLEAVYQVVEHFSQHYGQIAYITKMLTNVDLGFYRELDRTGRLPATESAPKATP